MQSPQSSPKTHSLFRNFIKSTEFKCNEFIPFINCIRGCIFRKRDQIKNILKVSDNDNVEKLLFHGTSSDVIDAICKHNFDHRCHGKNGTKYGKGSYFAVKASYSNNYCNGMTRSMFLARVLTGEFKQGDESLHRPPLKDPSNPASDLYDSCVDNESSPSIFVIFNDEQCYPLYLITYDII